MNRSTEKRITSIVVVVLLLISTLLEPLSAHVLIDNNALLHANSNIEPKETTSIRELDLRRDKNVKQYYLGNGITQMISFGKSIHRKNVDGEWEEIDNSLDLTEDGNGKIVYSTKDGWASFSGDTSEGATALLKNNEYCILLSFANDDYNKELNAEIINPESFDSHTQFESVENAIEYFNSHSSESIITYSDIFCDTDLEFILSDNNLKSNIIISSSDVTNTYHFRIDLEGLRPLESEDGQLFLIDEMTEECVYEISSPYMIDANGEMSDDIIQTMSESEDGTYLLTIEINYEWINNPERAFPVTIDPYLSETNYYDTYIDSSNPSQNYGSSQQICISNSCIGLFRPSLSSIPQDSTITSAYFYVSYFFDSGVIDGSITVGLYRALQYWGEYYWTWNYANQYTNLGLSYSMISSQSWSGSVGAYSSSPVWKSFMVTNVVNSWFNGTDKNGLAIKREGGDNSVVYIKSYECANNYRPYFVIQYQEPIIDEGVYYIKNKINNLYLETDEGSYTSGTFIKQRNKVNGDIKQLYKITFIDTYNNNRYYDIRPMTNNGLGLYAPYTSSSDHHVKVTSMSTSDGWYDVSHAQKWTIQTNAGGGYVTLENALNNNGGYLCSQNSNAGTALITTTTLGTNCRWVLEPYTGNDISNVIMTYFAPTIAIGDCIDYDAIMYDSQVGVNGPVTYSVLEMDYSTTNKATINASTGQMTAILSGNVKICVSYSGIPDLWEFNVVIIPTYGCRDYYIIEEINDDYRYINCLGYAVDYGLGVATDTIQEDLNIYRWFNEQQEQEQLSQVQNSNELLALFKPKLEDWFDDNLGTNNWEEVTNNGGINVVLNNNQWLVVMRVGYHDFIDGNWGAHFWYRTNTGEWVNKRGFYSYSEKLTNDLPTDDDSPGWGDGVIQYYDSDLVYYVITSQS